MSKAVRPWGNDPMDVGDDWKYEGGISGRCTAMSRQTKERCKRRAIPGKTKCKHHGGKNPGRPVKDAKHSKYLVDNMNDKFEDFLSDPHLMDLTEEISILRSVLAAVSEEDLLKTIKEDGLTPEVEHTIRLIETIAKLIEKKSKIELSAKGSVSIIQLKGWTDQVTNILTKNCGSCKELMNVSEQLQELKI